MDTSKDTLTAIKYVAVIFLFQYLARMSQIICPSIKKVNNILFNVINILIFILCKLV